MFLNGYGNNYNYYNRNQPLPPVEGNGFNYSYHNRGGEEDEIDLASLFGMVKRRSLMIIATTLALAIPPSVWILSQPPVYEGKVEILVESPNQRGQGAPPLSGRRLVGTQSNLDYETQIKVLKSPAVLAPIVKSIQSKYPEILLLYPGGKKDKKKEALVEKLKVKQGEKKSSIIQVEYRSESKEKVLFVLQQTIQGYLQYQKKEHIASIRRQIDFTEEEIKKTRAEVARWDSELEKFQKNRGIMTPNLQTSALQAQLAFIQGERERVKMELEGLRKLSRELQDKLQLTPEQADIVTLLNGQPYYLQLVSRLRETETEIALETVKLGSEHPAVRELKLKKEQLIALLETETDKILKNPSANLSLDFLVSIPQNQPETAQQLFQVNNQIQVLQAKDRGLAEALKQLNQNISGSSSTNTEYNQILRESEIANERLVRLLASRDNLRNQLYASLFPWQLLTPIDENIIKDVSKKHLLLAAVAVASVFVSLFVALMAEALSTQFRSLEEIRNTINLPLLATVAYNKNLASFFNHKKARKKGIISQQTIHEAFNLTLDNYCHLYTNISLLSADKPINSIVISAASPEEGKSTTAVGLAKAAALLGKKVLLVDTDMRAPSIHSYLGIDNHTGLSHLITDNLPVEEVIKPDPQQENLFVITSGTVPPNPTRLLASHKWHSLMAQLHSQFDFVIYDSPPLALFPDAKSIIPHTDGLVLVLGMGKASRPVIQQLLTDLQVAHITVLGMVVNGLKKEFNSSYGYYSYYGYYGYGHSHYATRRG